jgi:hypothetical protein
VAGDRNVVIGSEAMPNAAATGTTTNGQNIVIGYRAMNAPTGTIGGNNIAIGSQTLYAATFTGTQNIAIGLGALGSVTSATGNIGIGRANAGSTITSGQYNTTISGFSGGNVTTGSFNLLIGYIPVVGSATSNFQMSINNVFNSNTNGQIFWNMDRSSGNFPAAAPTFKSSVAFEVSSVGQTGRGMYTMPLTKIQRDAIGSPQSMLWITNTTDLTFDIYDGTRWNNMPNGLKGSGTLDFPSTGAHSSADLTITVTGAADGDMVILGVPNASVTNDSNYSAWVSAANTVTVRFNHYGSGNSNPASGTFKVYVIKN